MKSFLLSCYPKQSCHPKFILSDFARQSFWFSVEWSRAKRANSQVGVFRRNDKDKVLKWSTVGWLFTQRNDFLQIDSSLRSERRKMCRHTEALAEVSINIDINSQRNRPWNKFSVTECLNNSAWPNRSKWHLLYFRNNLKQILRSFRPQNDGGIISSYWGFSRLCLAFFIDSSPFGSEWRILLG